MNYQDCILIYCLFLEQRSEHSVRETYATDATEITRCLASKWRQMSWTAAENIPELFQAFSSNP